MTRNWQILVWTLLLTTISTAVLHHRDKASILAEVQSKLDKIQAKPIPSVLALPSPTQRVVFPEAEADENAMLRSHWKAIERCWNEGRVPVMGYNYAVVCLIKQNVAWTQIDKLPF